MAPLLENPIGHLASLPVQPATPTEEFAAESLVILASNNAIIHNKRSPATIVVSPSTGKILDIFDSVLPASNFPPNARYTDYSPKFLLPGLVDAHVHLNEPGFRTEWEGFETGTRAAASGGVTTLIDMPLNAIPPTTTVEHFNTKIKAAEGQCWVDVGFYGGVIPGNEDQLVPLVEAGVKGFKCFLINSGVDEFPSVTASEVALAMSKLKDTKTTLMFHAEMLPPVTKSVGDYVTSGEPPSAPTGPLNKYRTFLESRPSELETYAIDAILSCAPTAPDLQLHIVHLSAAAGVPMVKAAQEKGVKLSAETCFHYLALNAEHIEDGDTRHKCCPPIREAANQDILWEGLRDGTITTVVSDHSPCTPNLKMLPKDGGKGNFFEAWGGISTVGLGLSVLHTEGLARGISIEKMVEWTCYNTAKQVGLLGTKGALEIGWDADIAVFDPEAEFEVATRHMHFKNKITPYEGKTLHGRVQETWLRGTKIYDVKTPTQFDEKTGPVGQLLIEKK